MNKKCIYYVEGDCEEQFIKAMKLDPAKLMPGKVKVFNIIQNEIPKSQLLSISPGTIVVLVFDTDKPLTDYLKKNIDQLKKYCQTVRIVYLAQVMDFEDELVKATDVKKAQELTKSKSKSEFKSDFCRMNAKNCRNMLDRHKIDVGKMWITDVNNPFDFIQGRFLNMKLIIR